MARWGLFLPVDLFCVSFSVPIYLILAVGCQDVLVPSLPSIPLPFSWVCQMVQEFVCNSSPLLLLKATTEISLFLNYLDFLKESWVCLVGE